MTHPNAATLHRLLTGLQEHQPDTMASCYHADATFEDIAFRRRGRQEIHEMWRMICLGDSELKATFEILHVDDHTARVHLVDDYKFGKDKRPVINVIDSHFVFRGDLIIEHRDFCDTHAWAKAAIGGITGVIVGRVGFIRRFMAGRKLKKFLQEHPAGANRPAARPA
jgi:hypothetical protein